ncbi:ATP-binding cassette domain-containing protein [Salinicoccus sp. ID82-1]|uniref:ATP-binding cassette domain-containing protein n=1 Tax=Salinicoccus cyprini TaxID=2493691 RepID=A0A558AV34_9STAP|nr:MULTISPECIES: ATP-binding cassette domain-containing protein [Salinicoccus]MCG1010498.1 ATP-binding cassette domain-containing protein [Salinicoccus sp. ID82-1]TVT28130.1 ATP-binding cassette domain-containing protein [Salinicoccus cyprini]
MIEMMGVSKSFSGKDGPFKAVDGVDLSIKEKEIFGIIGESGAGKSTLMRFINALETPDSGQVLVNGVAVDKLRGKSLRNHQKHIGMVFQHFNLLANRTVEENILLPLKLHRYDQVLTIDEVLEFTGLTDKRSSYPAELSGGQKQRVGIARALIIRPHILLCDEPTSALDENTTYEIAEVLRKAQNEYGMTVVIVTHELGVIKTLCHRAAVLEHGRLIDIMDVVRNSGKRSEQSYYARVLEVLKDE